jgi:cytochrome c-type biogenesis protein CcmE
MRVPQLKFIIAGGLIIGGICFLMFSGIDSSMVYYYTVSEVKEKGPELSGKGIRISGHVLDGTIQKDSKGTLVDFVVYERSSDQKISVRYEGLIPDTFKDNAEVVVEGVYDSSNPVFEATTLLAKCPSKYEAIGEEHPGDYPKEAESAAVTQ